MRKRTGALALRGRAVRLRGGRNNMIATRTLFVALLAVVSSPIASPQNQGDDRRLPDSFIDGAVDSKGNTYVLTQSGLKRTSPDGATLAVDVASGLRRMFDSSGYQALALSADEGPAVLWGARKGDAIQSVVTFVNSQRNVQLGQAVSLAPGFSVAPNHDIFVFGLSLTQKPQRLVHRYSGEGEYLGSFNPFEISNLGDPEQRRKFGRSRILATLDGVFVVCPLFDTRVVKCIDGRIEKTFDFGTASSEGLRRRPTTLFSQGGRVYVQVFVGGPTGVARHEIYVYEKSDFRLEVTAQNIFGQVIGLTPDGQPVTRDVPAVVGRDSIGIRTP
jgi:hypothetical protein